MAEMTKRVALAARPNGVPKPSDFKVEEMSIPKPGRDEFLVKNLFLSVDPYMRGRMNGVTTYAKGVDLGETMVGGGIGQVTESNHPDFAVGDIVNSSFGWQTHAISDGTGARKVDPELAPISTALGVLGMPGLTAYFGLLDVSTPGAGETGVVGSGGRGGVGRRTDREDQGVSCDRDRGH